jgi:hypothetical protein
MQPMTVPRRARRKFDLFAQALARIKQVEPVKAPRVGS